MALPKMTNKDRADAYLMRLEGASLQEVADRFGVSKQCISQMLPTQERSYQKPRDVKMCVYPAIREFMDRNRCTYSRLAAMTGIGKNKLRRGLIGETEMTMSTINKILDVIEIPYEDAFRKEAKK